MCLELLAHLCGSTNSCRSYHLEALMLELLAKKVDDERENISTDLQVAYALHIDFHPIEHPDISANIREALQHLEISNVVFDRTEDDLGELCALALPDAWTNPRKNEEERLQYVHEICKNVNHR